MSPEQEGKDKNKLGDGSDFDLSTPRHSAPSKRERTLPGPLDKKRKGADKNGGDQKRQKQDASTQTDAPCPKQPKAVTTIATTKEYMLELCSGRLQVRAQGEEPIEILKHTILHTWPEGKARLADLNTLSLHEDWSDKVPFTFVTSKERACYFTGKGEKVSERSMTMKHILGTHRRKGYSLVPFASVRIQIWRGADVAGSPRARALFSPMRNVSTSNRPSGTY